MFGQEPDVVGPVTQGWQRKRDGGQAEKQIGAESTSLHFALQIAVGRGDEPDIDLLGPGVAQSRKLAGLQDSKEMRLQIEREIANLVEKEGAAMFASDKTDTIAIRAGECTLHETEKFRSN